ncbi:hypothetical protein KGF56_004269 [Candida oxycetoniae]|uniref:Uncharacterized protein n=1 Tax=Candida oxycetoniae TaxID=497107 RepID=A0AAI9STZ1_9ASCO|nr:uncharacterized protein KGF56_004269 [Candida oxycetoniae]KAI3403016.1 hypothetical protein KGF56_004269 [Candida oxycetoniae]
MKCDENRLNGKCQACTRNFLQCCWPEVKRDSLVEKNQVVKSSLVRKKCDINSLLVTTTTTTTAATKTPIGVINPYPSPLQSPIKSTTALGINDDVGFMQLPPLYNPSYRLQTKDSNVRGAKREQGWSLGTNNKNRTTATKFVITSFNAENNLCDVSS